MNKLSKAEDLNFLKIKTCVLKVNIHCEGCKKKVKKLLQKIDGVYTIVVDTEQGNVTVTGNVDASNLIKKLRKSGKHAELWASKKNSIHDSHYQLPKLPVETPKGQKIPSNNSETKDQKMQLLQKALMNMKLPSTNNEKSVKFSVQDQDFDGESEFDDSFDDEDDYFDETDASDDEINDYGTDVVKAMNPATKGIVTAKKGFGNEVHGKGNGGSKNGSGGTHEAKNGSHKGNKNGDGNNNGHKQGNGGNNSSGLGGIPTAAGVAPTGYLNRGMPAPVTGESLNPYQQQYMAEMMQQQRMKMMNEYPMAYGYPMPAPNTYTSYFSDENTGGNCRIM